ncbi:MAG: DUF3748 domain-containing protein [Acidobacteria bacterium]|nr:DUF3748 domain-containing protein [Acidobacteriota bacterium]
MPSTRLILLLALALGAIPLPAAERQVSTSPVNHNLDNNDNFSRDDRFLCFDTRESVVAGNGASEHIMKLNVATGAESIIYAPKPVVLDPVNAAPGVIACSYNPVTDEVIFIHGPFVSEIKQFGFYAKTNRRGAVIAASGKGPVRFMDQRDVTSEITIPGAHRGGTHRHEYSRDGRRIGFTYDDHLLTNYGRTLGMLMVTPKAPKGASAWFAVIVPIVPTGTAKTGDLEAAAFDSWIDARGTMRGFIGKVKEANGAYRESLFVADIPANIDITTSDSGTRTRFPVPPKGITIRRLTHQDAKGVVRGSPDGHRIAYLARAADGTNQVFLIDAHGSDTDSNAARRPVQATFFKSGVSGGFRWHPAGTSISAAGDGGIAAVCVKPGKLFGKAFALGTGGRIEGPVWSNSGKLLAYNKRVPTRDASGKVRKSATGGDFSQVFVSDFPDANNNGIADPLEK